MTRHSETVWRPPADDDEVAHELAQGFAGRFGAEPDGVWAAPGRVNLIGEHTDYNGGFALPFALPHRTYAAVHRREDGVLRLASVQQERTWEGRVADVRPGHPEGWAAYVAGVAWALAAHAPAETLGADVLVDGHVPLGAGLSSSAALSCSVGVALRDLVPELSGLDLPGLAAACVRAENDIAGAATGGMDQTVSLRAVDEHLLLLDARDFSIAPVAWTLPEHEVLVVDTRAHHSLADGQYAARRSTCERAARALGVGSLRELDASHLGDLEVVATLSSVPDGLRRVRHVTTENERVLDLVAALREQDPTRVGALMTASHVSLRDDYEVSCLELDVAVDAALEAGALGARMTGGGFGGSAVALVRRQDCETVASAVAAAFEDRGLERPHLLHALPSRPAGRIR
ncbi:galactokinase [Ornithinimicrobium tianjinense]|uniref:Galactokinase n=1 Tax=Ornithinimicrobium tianjinense TaxID=1195761 RepID=A0A917F2I2_9MICO|nr:galactokinase [Ornithinimicrobium tianjinense]GGF46627.1 galactokinase [Ornithinimicrobium tianjinense]